MKPVDPNPVDPANTAQVLRRFRVVFNAVRTHFQQVEKQVGLGGAQVWALSVVKDHPGIGMGGVAKSMDIHQSTASNLVRQMVERALVEALPIPEQAHSISVSLDRVSVPMEEPRSGPVEYKKDGRPKKMIQRVYRMAYAATVTLHDKKGQALHTLRYGRMPKGDIEQLCLALSDDVMTLVRACPSLLVVLLCDGAKELWNLLAKEFTQANLGHPVHRLVDLWHLLEKLGGATKLLYGEPEGAAALANWRLCLLNDSDAVEQILQTLRDSGKEQVRVGDSRPVHEAITYLENHRQDMRYAKARSLGLPIGSGNVEATCKSLFNVWLKRGGARWQEARAGRLVRLRTLALSGRCGASDGAPTGKAVEVRRVA